MTFNLKDLNFPAGEYKITVKAKGSYWRDSQSSSEVSYKSVEEQPLTIEHDNN